MFFFGSLDLHTRPPGALGRAGAVPASGVPAAVLRPWPLSASRTCRIL